MGKNMTLNLARQYRNRKTN